jgi:hypothetical protein
VRPHPEEDHRNEVGVLAELVGPEQVQSPLLDLAQRVGHFQARGLHRARQPLQVLLVLEDEQLGLLGVPVGADSLEDVAAHEAARAATVDHALVPRDDLAVHPRVHRSSAAHARSSSGVPIV